jgi:hypothetical protein
MHPSKRCMRTACRCNFKALFQSIERDQIARGVI